MSSSHTSATKPSILLALVALCIVHRFEPSWLALGVGDAARQTKQSPERISRLATTCLTAFERALAAYTRRGRPPRNAEQDARDTEFCIMRELLATATQMLSLMPPRVRIARDVVIGAWQRLRTMAGMTQQRFCKALGVSERTLRDWMQKPARRQPAHTSPPKQRKQKKRMRRGRFGFEVTLPGTQYAADTTDLRAFGVPLKLVAAQDIGGRDESLFDAVLVEEQESAAHVIEVLAQALKDRAGAQVLTDQGTPYMAESTRQALDELNAEHAPQKEGDPIGKSTVERAFGSVKWIARPMLSITNQLARAAPALRKPDLAKAFTRLCIAMLLRAWQHGARAARAAIRARGDITPEELALRAEASRERAVARERSSRLLLAHIHEIYDFERSAHAFIHAWRHYPLSVLREAERAFRAQLLRNDIRNRGAYFAAIVRRLYDDHQQLRAARQREREDEKRLHAEREQQRVIEAQWASDPSLAIRAALRLVAMQWRHADQTLLYGGEGLGLGRLRVALRKLFELHPTELAVDIAEGALHQNGLEHQDSLGPAAISALNSLARREINARKDRVAPCTTKQPFTIFPHTGPEGRPTISDVLRI